MRSLLRGICASGGKCVFVVVFTATKVNRLTPLPYLFICIRNLLNSTGLINQSELLNC
jgi:hypothetical protein